MRQAFGPAAIGAINPTAGEGDRAEEAEEEEEAEYEIVEHLWELRTYPLTGRQYIFNRTTKEIRPAEDAVDLETNELLEYTPIKVKVPRGPDAVMTEVELRWEEHAETRADRFPYYLNRATGECVWTFPFEDPDIVPEFPELVRWEFIPVKGIEDLPVAPFHKRLAAAAIDVGATAVVMGAYSGVMYFEMGPKCLPGIAILMFAAFMWRDAVLDEGTRSVGKRYMGLEVVRWDGTMPGRLQTVGRSVYFPAHYLLISIGVLEPDLFPLVYASGGLLALDLGLMATRGFRLGDYMFQTKVIEEAAADPPREERLEDRKDYLAQEKAAS